MTHRRTRVRLAAKTLLSQALPNIPVNSSPDVSVQSDTAPEIDIYTPSERVEQVLSTDPVKQVYLIQLFVSVVTHTNRHGEDTASELDALCVTIERALCGTLGNVADSCRLGSSLLSPAMDNNKTSFWEAVLNFEVRLTETTQPLPPAGLSDLVTLVSEFETSPPATPPHNTQPEITTTVIFT